ASSAQQQVTQLLVDWSSGDAGALHKLIPFGAARTASAGTLLYEPRRRGAHLANHRARQRGVSSVCRQDTSAMATPATLFRRGCATNATHHGWITRASATRLNAVAQRRR